jgi:DNA-binding PadR family transcriptional regulator
MTKPHFDMIRGTLDMLILKVLSVEPMHGWCISERIQGFSDEARQGWINSEWRVTENNRRARYYTLSVGGEEQLGIESDHWTRLSGPLDYVMGLT